MFFSKVFGRPRHLVPVLIFSCALLFFQLPVCASQGVSLAWDPSGDPNVAGYRIYYGVKSRAYTELVDVGNVTYASITGLAAGTTYYFAATTYDNSDNESHFSNEASFQVLATTSKPDATSTAKTNSPPLTRVTLSNGKFGFTVFGTAGTTYIVQASTNLVDWESVKTNSSSFNYMDTNAAGFKQRFFRTISQSL